MATGVIKKRWTVANNGGWAETFYFSTSPGVADDLTGYAAQLNLIRNGRPTSEALTYNSTDIPAYLTVAANAVSIAVPPAVTGAWTPGVYDLQLRVLPASPGVDRYNLLGPGRLNVVEAPGA